MTRHQTHRRPFQAATPTQITRIKRLVETRDTTRVQFLLTSRRQDAQSGRLSKAAANALIEALVMCPTKAPVSA